MTFSLDANVISALFRGQPQVVRAVRLRHVSDFVMSAVAFHEIVFGACRSRNGNQLLALIRRLPFDVLPLDSEDARQAAEIRAALVTEGRPIGPYDALIAGQARARNLTVITRNVREFGRVPGLQVANWED